MASNSILTILLYNNKSVYDYVRRQHKKHKRRMKSHLLEICDIITLILWGNIINQHHFLYIDFLNVLRWFMYFILIYVIFKVRILVIVLAYSANLASKSISFQIQIAY